MAITLGTNVASLVVQRRLNEATTSWGVASEKLSSGLRINRASDDAAGLAVTMSLQANSRIYGQAIKNVTDGITTLSIAEGSLNSLSGIVTRQMELAEQAANGAYSTVQRRALNNEANALVDEFNRIVESTTFNGIKLLDGTLFSGLQIQAGAGNDGILSLDLGTKLARTVGNGNLGAVVTYAPSSAGQNPVDTAMGDINGDGFLDLLQIENGGFNVAVHLGNGDGTFRRGTTTTKNSNAISGSLVDVNSDGKLDLLVGYSAVGKIDVALGNGNATFQAPVTYTVGSGSNVYFTTDDFNGDGKVDILSIGSGQTTFNFVAGNGDGTFQAGVAIQNTAALLGIASGDINGDGKSDLVLTSTGASTRLYLGNGDGTFKLNSLTGTNSMSRASLADVNGDGAVDIVTSGTGKIEVFRGNGDGTFLDRILITSVSDSLLSLATGDLNGDGYDDIVVGASSGAGNTSILVANTDGTFKAPISYANQYAHQGRIQLGDFNRDGVYDLGYTTTDATNGNISIRLTPTTRSTLMARLNLGTQSSARSALPLLSAYLDRINLEMGAIGSMQSRYSIATNTLRVGRENFDKAASQISDADVASEAAESIRSSILQNVATSVASQANQLPQIALMLLR